MLISAIGLLEQEYAFGKKHVREWPEVKGNEYAYMMMAMGATAQTAVVSSMPYVAINKAYGAAYNYQWVRTAPQHKIKGFRIKSPGFKAVPYGWSTSKVAGRRLLAARIGARFIPYVGWALLAYDVYEVGKWVHGKTRWGNPTPGP